MGIKTAHVSGKIVKNQVIRSCRIHIYRFRQKFRNIKKGKNEEKTDCRERT